MYSEFFAKAIELASKQEPFAIAIVVNAEKPSSARPGDKALITAEGTVHGWIGGSCAFRTVISEAQKALADGQPRLIRLTTDPQDQTPRSGILDMPMTCASGGTMEIYIEPQQPVPHLMVIGDLPIAQTLIRLGKVVKYHVIAVDPGAASTHSNSEADERIANLSDIAARITPFTYVVVASHGNYDEIALEHALRSNAAYVALVASKTRSKAVLEYLAAQGLTQAQLDRLKCPAGLDIQARQPEEIAVSILAEIIQRRRGESGAHKHEHESEPAPQPAETQPAEAIDPVCGMTVDIATATYKSVYKGQPYYFCGPGCKLTFDRAPEQYAGMINISSSHE